MAVSRRLRFEILRRDNHTCRYCGQAAPDVKLTVDHVLPEALGGSDEASNLVTACQPCNAGKSSIAPDSPIVEGVADDALKWALAITRATEIQRARRAEKDDYIAAFDHEWRRWSYGRDGKQFVSRPADWEATIARHFDASLDIDALTQLVRDVITRATHPSYATAPKGYVRDEDMWRYFCGALRNHMRERSELATELLAERVT